MRERTENQLKPLLALEASLMETRSRHERGRLGREIFVRGHFVLVHVNAKPNANTIARITQMRKRPNRKLTSTIVLRSANAFVRVMSLEMDSPSAETRCKSSVPPPGTSSMEVWIKLLEVDVTPWEKVVERPCAASPPQGSTFMRSERTPVGYRRYDFHSVMSQSFLRLLWYQQDASSMPPTLLIVRLPSMRNTSLASMVKRLLDTREVGACKKSLSPMQTVKKFFWKLWMNSRHGSPIIQIRKNKRTK
ncbi:hypothetical protein PsorP6_014514 [Peronosclerospora sorghi]|uniref:Uncharacterized protein n=1 Tax=Peronosclerospora sorghi TaxID=230839 RepID=A0ACC0VU60_9STRA|nr:hypothetical protein PsorP6_014514 [Peronosclerospora sorghi]